MCRALFVGIFFLGACNYDGCPDVTIAPDEMRACYYSDHNELNVIVVGEAGALPPGSGVQVSGTSDFSYTAEDGSFTLLTSGDRGDEFTLTVFVECWEDYTQDIDLVLTVEDCTEDP